MWRSGGIGGLVKFVGLHRHAEPFDGLRINFAKRLYVSGRPLTPLRVTLGFRRSN